jgi:hypothetical protein
MSFGREKDLALVEVKQQQMKNVKDGIMTMEQIQKHENKLVSDETEIAKDENELALDELSRNTL